MYGVRLSQLDDGGKLYRSAGNVRQSYAGAEGGILAIVPRGEVIRNFEYSGVFERIASGSAFSLLSISTDSEIDQILKEKYADVFPLEELPESWIVRFQREIIDVAHGRWLWSNAARRRWRQRDLEAKTMREKVVRLTKKSIGFPLANDLGLRFLTKTERFSSRLFSSSDRYVDLYKKLKPSLVFNGSHIHSRNAIQAVQSAQWLGIPTATFIFSWDNLTSQGRVTLPYDYFLVWNESIKTQLLEMYPWIRAENVFVTGTPQFDFHFRPQFHLGRKEYCEQIGADSNRPIVFYATGMANHMPDEPEIVERIADILDEFDSANRPQLLVRIYAKDLSNRFDNLKRRREDILFPKVEWDSAWLTPKFEDSYALVNTLRHCALGINVASTLSLELCMFDKPVINVGYNPYSVDEDVLRYADYYEFDHYKPVVDSGAVQVAWSEADMRNLIRSCLSDPAARKTNREKLINRMFGDTLDGRSSDRVAETLLKLASQRVGDFRA